ncbi:MAG: DUF2780 domain-containing protein [Chthoniobacterales bacterium]
MEAIIQAISQRLGLSETIVRSGVGILLRFIKDKAEGSQVETLLNLLPGASGLMSQEAGGESGESGGGGLMGSILGSAGGLLGGNLGDAAEALGAMQKAGIPLDKVGPFANEFMKQAEGVAGGDAVQNIIDQIPALKGLLK